MSSCNLAHGLLRLTKACLPSTRHYSNIVRCLPVCHHIAHTHQPPYSTFLCVPAVWVLYARICGGLPRSPAVMQGQGRGAHT